MSYKHECYAHEIVYELLYLKVALLYLFTSVQIFSRTDYMCFAVHSVPQMLHVKIAYHHAAVSKEYCIFVDMQLYATLVYTK